MATKDQTCAERIAGQLQSRIEDLTELHKMQDGEDDEQREEAYDREGEMPLSVENLRVVKILISTGGPADWFEYTLDSENDVTRIVYHFQDWFDGASLTLEGEDFNTAERFGRNLTADFYTE